MFFPNHVKKENESAESVPDIDKMFRKITFMENRIKEQDNKINDLIKENKDYLNIICKIDTFMKQESFDVFQDLVDFTEKWKNHICKNNDNNNVNINTLDNNIESDSIKIDNIQNKKSSQNKKNENVKDNCEDITSDDKSSNINDNVNKKKKNKDVNETCPIYICNKNDERWKKYIVNKTNNSLIYNNELYDILINDNIDINNAADFVLDLKKMQNTESNRNKIKSKIKRYIHIYDIHKNDLKYIYFSINKMARLNNKDFNKWLIYLNESILSFKNTETVNTDIDTDTNDKNKTSQNKNIKIDEHISEINKDKHLKKKKKRYTYKCVKCKIIWVNNEYIKNCKNCDKSDNTKSNFDDPNDDY